MGEFKVGEETFKCTRMNLIDQWDVMQALLPTLQSVETKALMAVRTDESVSGSERMLPLFFAIARGVGDLTREQSHFVLFKCMSTVERRSGSGWAPIWSNGVPMFHDIDLAMTFYILGNVVKENFGNFLPALLRLLGFIRSES